ncbi:unnamed protein product [Effrenium voratum]|uniref:Ion transport domain-containing protein n=1 Tax=Effrenium voratum TaxID=2562239 RepID=A0AA36NJI0_9DINO|nr:unnamed protein product [Effrenium voratum]CAJ1453958.1 unnamed protein product [Effrenium voratum]
MTLNHPGQTLLYIKVAEWIFTALFTAELVLRLIAAGPRLFWSEDWMWAFLDLIIVLFSLWEVVVQLVCGIDGGSCNLQGVSGVTSLKTMRIIRITRLVKTVRLAKVFRFVMAFRMLITSIMHTLKSLFWALALLILIVYIFAVLFTQAVNDYLSDSGPMSQRELDNSQRYYGSMMQTMLSLFMSITSGVSWEEVLAPLQAISMAWVFIFLFYISFAYFAVLNVVTGVFCQSAIDGAQNDHATKVHSILAHKEAHLEQIRRLFSKLDAEDSGIITYDMFQERINSPAVRNFFATLGLDIWDAWSFFKCLDLDAGGAVEIEEFLMGCLRLRGQATAIDVGKIISNQTWQLRNQGHFQAYIEVKLQELTSQMATLTGVNGLSDEQMEMMFAKHGDESPEDSVINLSRMSEGEDPFEDG